MFRARALFVRSNCRGVAVDKPFETVEKQLLRAESQFSVIVVKARPPPVVIVGRRSSVVGRLWRAPWLRSRA